MIRHKDRCNVLDLSVKVILCLSNTSYRSEGSWFESCSWQFTRCGLILGMCHPSSFHLRTNRRSLTCVNEYRFLIPLPPSFTCTSVNKTHWFATSSVASSLNLQRLRACVQRLTEQAHDDLMHLFSAQKPFSPPPPSPHPHLLPHQLSAKATH